MLLAIRLLPLSASIEIRSTHFTTSDGIANNTVRCIFQDSKGFIWLGTLNGLSRFDGHSFMNYYPQDGVPSLMDHRVRKMQEDGYGLVWIDVISEMQCCYDLKRGNFIDFTGNGEYWQPYSGTARMSNGDVWMWHTVNGARRIRCKDGVYSSVTFRKEDGTASSSVATKVLEDRRGQMWILTTSGVERVKGDTARNELRMPSPMGVTSDRYTFFVSQNGWVFMEQSDRSFKEVLRLPGAPSVTGCMLLDDDLYIFTSSGGYLYHADTGRLGSAGELDIRNGVSQQDNRGNYWIYNNTGVVHYVNAQTHAVRQFRFFPEEKMRYIDFERYRIVHDSRDIIWVSTYGNGLFAYNVQTDELQHFTANMNDFSHIPSDYLLHVMEDRSGGIWVSSEFSGVSRLTVLNEGAMYIYPEGRRGVDDRSNMIRMLTCMDDGRIYAGTRRGGVYVYDKDMHLLEDHRFNSNIYAVMKDAEGHLWLGSRGGGLYIDGQWYRNQKDDPTSLANDNIFCMHRDRKDRMWVGTFNGGLDLAVKGKDGRYSFRHFFNHSYTQKQIRAISEDANGYIWVGTSNGIYIFQPDSLLNDPTRYLSFNSRNSTLRSNEVKSFCADSKGRMWIATSGVGLTVCQPLNGDYANLTFKRYDVHDGLVDNMVQAIVEDHQGRIWVSTEYGVSCLDVDKLVFENYFFSSYVLGNSYSDNSCCVTEDGKIMFGSGLGLVVIEPGKTGYKSVALPPTVTLTGLKINGVAVQSDEADYPLEYDIAYTDEMELDYNQNSFEVDFSVFDYSQDGTVKYMYRLENYDKTWSTPSSLNFAAYKNLSPGHYRLHVKACNAVGVWGDKEAVLQITIHPPFWRSGWAYLLYAILVAVIVVLLFRALRKFNALRNRIQVEKQLTEYKLMFFTNISHEFRTPLTLIQGAIEKMEGNHSPKDNAYLLKIAGKSTKRLLRLVNQLLEFRKMQNNKLSLSLEDADVVSFLYDIFSNFKDAAESKNMDFRFVSSVSSYHMFIDKGCIDKVSYNLLSNAFKYTPAGGKIIFSVTVDTLDKKLIISVADTGVGIPEDKRGELFKRFMQSSFSGNSIGVGLHLSHELVLLHKGSITYAENEGGGSVFTVTLPTDASVYAEKDFLIPSQLLKEDSLLPRSEQSAGTGAAADDDRQSAPSVPLNKRKVLVIEDEDDVREFLRREIEPYFEVAVEADGNAGLERALTYDADLIICDVLMPGRTGFEVTRSLKENFATSHIPIILLTALSADDKQLEGVESGADAYITKPFSPRLLLARIFKLIEQRDKLREKFGNEPSMTRPAICSSRQDRDFADRLQAVMEKQIGNADFTIEEFAGMMKLGRSIFYRKVRGVTGYTPNEYIRVMRMKKAAQLLEEGEYNISEISYRVGMNDPFYFSKCFKQQFGVTPSAYQKKSKEPGNQMPDAQ
ncbi:MAG: two-component regulator propeller domain-containing protein [Bacteroides sp.]|nr:two-component regulator propeller domain-containing protein [Bacteroides sp.]